MSFPETRLRRLRRTPNLRALARETRLRPDQLILPLFVRQGIDSDVAVPSMPGVVQMPPKRAADIAAEAHQRGIRALLLFGIPLEKNVQGKSGSDADGAVPTAVMAIKERYPDMVVITDVCLCEYTDHGHCGLLKKGRDGQMHIDNDATLPLLAQQALAHARAGADIVAPSDMMDGRVQAIRAALDQEQFQDVAILSYAAKYASSFYGPFRDAAQSRPIAGPQDRLSYQMDPANRREALSEVRQDIAEGADLVMVKPALPYLDVIAEVRREFDVPVAAYQVSGEYSMLRHAAQAGLIDERAAMIETLTAIARAGASLIATYFAMHAAEELG